MRNYMDRRVTPPKLVTSPTWGPPPSCKQVLNKENGKTKRNYDTMHACFSKPISDKKGVPVAVPSPPRNLSVFLTELKIIYSVI